MQTFHCAFYFDLQLDYFPKINQMKQQGTHSVARTVGVLWVLGKLIRLNLNTIIGKRRIEKHLYLFFFFFLRLNEALSAGPSNCGALATQLFLLRGHEPP